MDFEEGLNGMLDGKWTCPDCGGKVRERTAIVNSKEKTKNGITNMTIFAK